MRMTSYPDQQPRIGSWEWDLESDSLYWSDEIYRLYGVEPGECEATFDLAWKPIHPDDKDRVGKVVEAARTHGIPYNVNYRVVLPNGDERAIHGVCGVKKDETGRIVRLFGTAQDVTERKSAEDALLASEERYRVTMEHIQEPVFVTDDHGDFTFICANVRHILGYTHEELQEMGNLSGLLGSAPLFDPAELNVRGALPNIERVIVDKHGVARDFLINVSRVSIQGGTRLYVCHDITERKQAEEALKESEQKYRELADSITDIFFSTDNTLRFTYWNQAFADFTGISAKEGIGKSMQELFADIADVELENMYLEVIDSKKSQRMEREYVLDGKKSYFEVNAYPTKTGMSVLVKNITEHKRAEEERDRILTVSHDLICIAGMDGYFKYLNPAWERTLGYTREELLSRPFLAFIHPDDHGKNDAEVEKLTAGQPTIDFENRYIHQDGSFRYISWTATPMPEKHVIYCIGRDITERKQAEQALQEYSERLEGMVETRTRELQEAQEQLLRQEKLAALGQLAGSVAHELRHPLGVLSNAAYFLNMSLPDAGETTREYLEMMAAEIRKADKIISDLLDFSRHQGHSPGDRTEVRLAELMAETLAEQPPPDGIDVVNKIDAEGPPVLVDVQQIKQVLANLIVNAYQAMPDGGTLSVGSRQPAAGSPEHCVLITVRDTGCGIPPENLEKLFEPLFTTKPKGIGLGLAVCRNLVKANGGAISVESEEGVGSTFSMSLPVVKQEETV